MNSFSIPGRSLFDRSKSAEHSDEDGTAASDAGPSVPEPSREQLLAASARTALHGGDLDAALKIADELLEAFPADRQGFVVKIQALMAAGRWGDALETATDGTSAYPEDLKLLSFARNCALRHAGAQTAMVFALKFAELAPGNLKNELLIADCQLAFGNIDAAIARMDPLIDANPAASQPVMLKAQALLQLGRREEALQLLTEFLPRHSNDLKFLSLMRNILFGLGRIADAKVHGEAIAATNPEDHKNRVFLIQCHLALGEFAEALSQADVLTASCPDDVPALMLRAQALVALHRPAEALKILEGSLEQNPDDARLLNMARNVAFQNGRFAKAAAFAERFSLVQPTDDRFRAFIVHGHLATANLTAVETFFESLELQPEFGFLWKEKHYFGEYKRLKETMPVFASAWELALANSVERRPTAAGKGNLDATMIQYWSQGAPPPDVQIVCNEWKRLFEREELGRVELFDRASAGAWIAEYAPEFESHFAKAFHYAMESDIFRIAYASKLPCIYMDIDSWPLEHTAAILRFAVRSRSTMLYLRAHRATIVNGFFVATPECAFIRELVDQSLAIDLDSLPKDYLILESTFGPSRYRNTFMDLLTRDASATASTVDEVPGCSMVSVGGSRIYFSHEAAVASVRPPFPLGYKATDDYWKFISLPDTP